MKKKLASTLASIVLLLILSLIGIQENITSDSTTANSIDSVSTTTQAIFYDVVRVADGDTLTIKVDGENQTLRLIGIDTPETVDPRKEVECFGKEASSKAKELLLGQKVRIEKDATQGEFDKYGRTLAYVHLEDGTSFNKYMIEQGYAYEYTYSKPYKYQLEYKAAQKSAETSRMGLWGDGICSL